MEFVNCTGRCLVSDVAQPMCVETYLVPVLPLSSLALDLYPRSMKNLCLCIVHWRGLLYPCFLARFALSWSRAEE